MADKKTIECIILRDFWDADGERQRKGKTVHLEPEAALDAVETGAVTRVKG